MSFNLFNFILHLFISQIVDDYKQYLMNLNTKKVVIVVVVIIIVIIIPRPIKKTEGVGGY